MTGCFTGWCRAVEGDDWSAVIDGQTAETVAGNGAPAEAAPVGPQHPAATPFARASVHRSIGAHTYCQLSHVALSLDVLDLLLCARCPAGQLITHLFKHVLCNCCARYSGSLADGRLHSSAAHPLRQFHACALDQELSAPYTLTDSGEGCDFLWSNTDQLTAGDSPVKVSQILQLGLQQWGVQVVSFRIWVKGPLQYFLLHAMVIQDFGWVKSNAVDKVYLLAGDSAPAETPDLTVESVNAALDEVRPYLIADGGNVEVASISDGVVYLRLQVPAQSIRPPPPYDEDMQSKQSRTWIRQEEKGLPINATMPTCHVACTAFGASVYNWGQLSTMRDISSDVVYLSI